MSPLCHSGQASWCYRGFSLVSHFSRILANCFQQTLPTPLSARTNDAELESLERKREREPTPEVDPVRLFKRRLVQVRLHFLLTSSASVLILQRVRKEVVSVAESSGSAKAKFKPVPLPEVEVKDEPLPTSPAFLSDEPESEAEPKKSCGGGKHVGISLQACLRCLKHINQPSSHMLRGKTVSTGYLCDIGTGVCCKCSYCAHMKHYCELVSYSPVLLEFR